MKLRVLDLFSGIGGFSLGLERTGGFETVAFCEISPKCRHLLKHHWPEVPAYDDICTLTAQRLTADGVGVDVLCGGFPCQDISTAGTGAGLAGERSGLWREYARLIRELRPRVVIVENVSALLGRGLGDVLGDLAALGYDAWWDCIPASAVGAPHQRDRVWIIAYSRSQQYEGFGDALCRALAAQFLEAHSVADASVLLRASCDDNSGGSSKGSREISQLGDGDRHARTERSGWLSEPDVGRVAHGVPARVDRLHGLGNAVVPEIPRRLGQAILTATASNPTGEPNARTA